MLPQNYRRETCNWVETKSDQHLISPYRNTAESCIKDQENKGDYHLRSFDWKCIKKSLGKINTDVRVIRVKELIQS